MTINWYGEGCFKITEGAITIVTDPFDSSIGLTPPRNTGKTDIIVKTIMPALIPGKDRNEAVDENGTHTLVGPGEYEIKGIHVSGYPLLKDSAPEYLKSVWTIRTDDLTVGLLGHLTEFNEPEILEELGHIDILIIPGGGKPFIDQEAAAKLIRQIEPKIVVPSFFKVPGLKRKAEGVEDFLKELGSKAESEEKLSVKKRDLGEKMRVALLKI